MNRPEFDHAIRAAGSILGIGEAPRQPGSRVT